MQPTICRGTATGDLERFVIWPML
jgi:hypothetical protein